MINEFKLKDCGMKKKNNIFPKEAIVTMNRNEIKQYGEMAIAQYAPETTLLVLLTNNNRMYIVYSLVEGGYRFVKLNYDLNILQKIAKVFERYGVLVEYEDNEYKTLVA